ncbi:MAG: hypothetical protein IKS78_03170, partial [Clostridia bacterium]|nr:hypothetical protein [Clostridia bacterium]
MKKNALLIGLMSLLLPALTGCDFVRKLAGRPTSQDIAAKKALIELEEQNHRRKLDSVRLVQQQAADSLAVADSLQKAHNIRSSKQLGGLSAARLSSR